MKTVLTAIITSVITVVIALFVVHAIMGDGEYMFSDNDHEKECTEHVKKECEKECEKKCTSEDAHHKKMEMLAKARESFEAELTDEEKATIEAIREKFEDIEHDEMCEEGKKKFMEQYKDDFEALDVIAANHKEYLDGVFAKVHMTSKGHEGEVKKDACPEAAKCKEATEKCKGEQAEAKAPEAEKKCKEAEAECKAECENTFKIHFLLMDFTCDHEDED